jgi:hypothetical protein
VEICDSKFDKENLPEIEDVVPVCVGLVTVDEESDIIRLVHYTTQEYFKRTCASLFPNTQREREIAMACVTFLSFDALEVGFCLKDEEFGAWLQLNPLYDYAARNWGHRAHATSTEVEPVILHLLKSEAKISSSS